MISPSSLDSYSYIGIQEFPLTQELTPELNPELTPELTQEHPARDPPRIHGASDAPARWTSVREYRSTDLHQTSNQISSRTSNRTSDRTSNHQNESAWASQRV